ncbi:MAG TPA: FixH family protein [Methylomirabilota bacterium]|nr:FixH family protein [Methylomirabilota bacterium]
MLKRLMAALVLAGWAVATGPLMAGWAADLKVIQTQQTKDVVVTLKSETGQWKPGKNAFVLDFTSAATKQPMDMDKVSLSTSMGMPGMAPMVAGATVTPDKAPGRYVGTIEFPDAGTRQVAVSWDGPAGKGSARFSVSVR